MATRLGIERTNTILYCHAWQACVRFYRELLSFPVSFETAWFVEFQLTTDSYLSIANAAQATIHDVEGQGITLSWSVPDLVQTRQQISLRGIAVTPIQRKWGAHLFYCHDPEGHRIEFWSPDATE